MSALMTHPERWIVFNLLKLAWKCWRGLREFVLSEYWKVNLRTYGQWAVVTGATSGIGKAYAKQLAQRGLDVILVSRSDEKLQVVAKEIEDRYGRKTRTIRVDFTDGHSIYRAIAKELEGLEIGILVNNVGMTHSDHLAYFLEIPDKRSHLPESPFTYFPLCSYVDQKITQVINCNILSVSQKSVIHLLCRGSGLIINISSEAGNRPHPLFSLYSATKIFVTYFSQCLHAEYKSKGITVQCVAPLLVSTNMTNNMKVNCFVKSASEYAREALNTVGHSSYTSGCLSHALQNMALTVLMPDWLRMSSFFIRVLRNYVDIVKGQRQACKEDEKFRAC
uniref:Hydroxysteroid (20-beta) dehydrogenase 2 n=1 Tax=Echeneis naucrates TaxID=173247 RepID=A0A665UM79_ECHNA